MFKDTLFWTVFIFIYISFYIKDYKTLKLITYLFKIIPPSKIGKGVRRLSIASLLVISKISTNIGKCSGVAP